jgi:hypothetical protein
MNMGSNKVSTRCFNPFLRIGKYELLRQGDSVKFWLNYLHLYVCQTLAHLCILSHIKQVILCVKCFLLSKACSLQIFLHSA